MSAAHQRNGRIGGLRAHALHDAATMTAAAHKAANVRRFEVMADPEGRLDPAERSRRADRLRRAHMLALSAKSAEARRRKAGP